MGNTDKPELRPLWRRLGWMAAIWLISVAALGVVAALIRMAIAPS